MCYFYFLNIVWLFIFVVKVFNVFFIRFFFRVFFFVGLSVGFLSGWGIVIVGIILLVFIVNEIGIIVYIWIIGSLVFFIFFIIVVL